MSRRSVHRKLGYPAMASFTRVVLETAAGRSSSCGCWSIVAGGWATGKLRALQSNTFAVPGTDSERVRDALEQHFGDRPDGSFTVVFRVDRGDPRRPRRCSRLQVAIERGARAVPGGEATDLRVGEERRLRATSSRHSTSPRRRATRTTCTGQSAGRRARRAYVTGARGDPGRPRPDLPERPEEGRVDRAADRARRAVAVFGLSFAVTIPFLFAASTVFGTLGIVYGLAHWMTMPTYVTNLVFLIGLGIAVDYSLLIVYRFREELERDGLEWTTQSCARCRRPAAQSCSPAPTVAIGLALLLAMPLPFMRAMGAGGFLIPLVSIVAAVDAAAGAALAVRTAGCTTRPRCRVPAQPSARAAAAASGTDDVERGFWARLARSIMRRPTWYLVVGAAPARGGGDPALRAPADARLGEGDPAPPAVGAGLRHARSGRSGRVPCRRRSCSSTRGARASARAGRAGGIGRAVGEAARRPRGRRRLLLPRRPLRRSERSLRPGDRPDAARVRRGGVAGLRAQAARRLHARRARSRRTCACLPAADRRWGSTSSTGRTARSRGSCSACCCSRTCCCCAHSARCCCR